jgi:isopentenyl-diphosphate delta-isomerase
MNQAFRDGALPAHTDARAWPKPAAFAADIIPAIGADGLFPIDKMEAHRTGQLHLAVSVFLLSGQDMLIQRRAITKYHSGGLWANSCCTHPHWSETPADAAQRRTREELGACAALNLAGALTYYASVGSGLIEHERVQVFFAQVDKTGFCLSPHPDEVMETRWVSRDSVWAHMQARPEDFASWFQIYLARWRELAIP